MMLTQLADIARRTGYPVVEVSGWKTRGRPCGMRGVRTITCHHTANGGAKGNYPSLRVVRDGRSGLPGPLAHFGLGLDGTIFVIAAGKCNHAGVSRSVDYTNSYAIGIEAEAVGVPGTKGDWPAAQMDAYYRLCAALVAEFDLAADDVRGHKETCAPDGRKSDPSFGMAGFRWQVTAVNLKTPTAQEDDMQLTDTVTLSAVAAKAMGRKEGEKVSISYLLQWGGGGACRELAEIRALKVKIDTLTAAVTALAGNSAPAIKAAFDTGIARFRAELGEIDITVTAGQ